MIFILIFIFLPATRITRIYARHVQMPELPRPHVDSVSLVPKGLVTAVARACVRSRGLV